MSFIPIPTRSEVVTRLTKDKNRMHTEALKAVADKLARTLALPVKFDLHEFGPDADIQRAVVQALEQAEWRCNPVLLENKTLVGYEVQ